MSLPKPAVSGLSPLPGHLRRAAEAVRESSALIPRTMRLTLYRDLDISTLYEIPNQRPLVVTHDLG